MTCRKWDIGNFIELLENQLSSEDYDLMNNHINFCFDCQIQFMAVVDSLSSDKCSIDWTGLNDSLNQSANYGQSTGGVSNLILVSLDAYKTQATYAPGTLPIIGYRCNNKYSRLDFYKLIKYLQERCVEIKDQRVRLQTRKMELKEERLRLKERCTELKQQRFRLNQQFETIKQTASLNKPD
jgi:hypothetical protein